MPTVRKTAFLLLLAAPVAACQLLPEVVTDVRPKTIDPKSAVVESDIVVLGYPMSQRDVRHVVFQANDGLGQREFVETETTLRVLAVLKGSVLEPEIRFHYYDARTGIQIGPPQGPSGQMGSRGIFFLQRRSDAFFRTTIDVYRPDIPIPWLSGSRVDDVCDKPAGCIAKVLLTFHASYDAALFSAKLIDSVAISRQLTGFLSTLDLLDDLAKNDMNPRSIRVAACVELSKRYALEFPSGCSILIADTAAAQDHFNVTAKLREQLRNGGNSWIQHRIGTGDLGDMRRYLEILKTGPDAETRELAQYLLDRLP